MDENNKYCACTGTDAMFHIKLNQQGPEGKQGPQGIKGTDGISPSITVEDSTDDNYQLRVTTAYNTFVTPNLKGDAKVLIDPWTLSKPANVNIPQFALNKTVTNSDLVDGYANVSGGLGFIVNVDDKITGSHGVKTNFTFPFTSVVRQNGVITSVYSGNLLTSKALVANDPIMLTHNQDGTITLDFDDTNYQHKLTAGSNINITNNTISVTGMPTKVSDLTNDAGYLTTIPSEYVTDSELTAKDYVTNTELDNKGYVTQSSLSLQLDEYATKEELSTTNATVTNLQTTVASNTNSIGLVREDLSNLENTVTNNSADIAMLDADKLAAVNIIAGNNITIDKNGNNLTINSTGGVTIEDSSTTSEATWSSSKINSEITTVANEVVQVQTDIAELKTGKQDTLTAGDGIDITDKYLSPANNLNLANYPNSIYANTEFNVSSTIRKLGFDYDGPYLRPDTSITAMENIIKYGSILIPFEKNFVYVLPLTQGSAIGYMNGDIFVPFYSLNDSNGYYTDYDNATGSATRRTGLPLTVGSVTVNRGHSTIIQLVDNAFIRTTSNSSNKEYHKLDISGIDFIQGKELFICVAQFGEYSKQSSNKYLLHSNSPLKVLKYSECNIGKFATTADLTTDAGTPDANAENLLDLTPVKKTIISSTIQPDNSTIGFNSSGQLTYLPTDNVKSSTVANLVQISQADYDALEAKDVNTLYIIT